MRFTNIGFITTCCAIGLLLSGCGETVTNHIRQRDFRQLGRAELQAQQSTASPIANVFDMPGWTTDFDSARRFASANGQRTVVFIYQEEEGASDTAKTRLNALDAETANMQKVAVDKNKAPQIAAQFGAQTTPMVVVIDPSGNIVAQQGGNLTKKQLAYLLR